MGVTARGARSWYSALVGLEALEPYDAVPVGGAVGFGEQRGRERPYAAGARLGREALGR